MTREVTDYKYTCNGCGKETHASGESYPDGWVPTDNENYDDDAEDYCPACHPKRQP